MNFFDQNLGDYDFAVFHFLMALTMCHK